MTLWVEPRRDRHRELHLAQQYRSLTDSVETALRQFRRRHAPAQLLLDAMQIAVVRRSSARSRRVLAGNALTRLNSPPDLGRAIEQGDAVTAFGRDRGGSGGAGTDDGDLRGVAVRREFDLG
ncbi:hypothetical protein [Arenimonas sp.]|uniref:hypothetical protein n=1 Tax=Arenimonas sp. TaxID=1872635 RepID=UPI0039E61A64